MSIGVLNLKEIVTAFMVLFAIIDITGSVPVILELKERNGKVEAGKAALISFAMLVVFDSFDYC